MGDGPGRKRQWRIGSLACRCPLTTTRCHVGEVERLRQALEEIRNLAHNSADAAPDLIGLPDRWEQLVGRMGDVAHRALGHAEVAGDGQLCEHGCGRVAYIHATDPYQAEVNDNVTEPTWWCQDCWSECCDAI